MKSISERAKGTRPSLSGPTGQSPRQDPSLGSPEQVSAGEFARLRQSLDRAERALRTLSTFKQASSGLTTEEALFRIVCAVLCGPGGFRLAWVGMAEATSDRRVSIVAKAGDDDGYVSSLDIRWNDGPFGQGPSGTAIRESRVVTCRDFTQDEVAGPWRDAATSRGIMSSIAIPLRFDRARTDAVLTVYADQVDSFDEQESGLLRELAGDLEQRVMSLRSAASHAKAEAGRRQSEALLSQMIKYTPAAVAMFDRDIRYLQCSDRWLTDYRLDGPVIGRSHYDVFPDVSDDWKAVHQRALAGASERRECDPFIRADGTVEWLQWEVRPWWESDGRVGGIVMFTEVITERVRTEQALHESEELFRTATQRSPIGMGLLGLDGRWLAVNPALCEIAGYSEPELLATNFQSITHPADLPADLDEIARLLRGDIPSYRLEKRYIRKDGGVVTVQLDVSSVRDTEGNVLRFVSQVQDVSERKAHEAELKVANEKLRLTMGLARIGYWEYDVELDRFSFDDDFLALYGTPPGEHALHHMPLEEYARRFLPPEERYKVRQELAKAIADEGQRKVREVEHRIVRADGTSGHVVVRHVAVQDETGRTARVYGANQDITEWRRTEAAMEQHRRRANAIVETAMDGIITIDESRRIVVFNPAAERMFGCLAAEALGQPLDRFVPPRHREAHNRHIAGFQRSGTASRLMGDFRAVSGGLRQATNSRSKRPFPRSRLMAAGCSPSPVATSRSGSRPTVPFAKARNAFASWPRTSPRLLSCATSPLMLPCM